MFSSFFERDIMPGRTRTHLLTLAALAGAAATSAAIAQDKAQDIQNSAELAPNIPSAQVPKALDKPVPKTAKAARPNSNASPKTSSPALPDRKAPNIADSGKNKASSNSDVPKGNLSPEEKFAQDGAEKREPSKAANEALAMIDGALKKIDKEIKRQGNIWQFTLGESRVLVVTDPLAERMRIMIPIVPAEALTPELNSRLMQANFDSALDARYAVAQNLLWGTYIHSLTGLSEDEFISGLSQTLSIVQTFGTSFSSGTVVFGGGDSSGIIDNQLEALQKEREKANRI